MEKLIEKFYKEFCKLTNRSGGVLVHASIGEWNRFLAMKIEMMFSVNLVVKMDFQQGLFYATLEEFPMLSAFDQLQKGAVDRLVELFKILKKEHPEVVEEAIYKKFNKQNFVCITISDRFGNYYKID